LLQYLLKRTSYKLMLMVAGHLSEGSFVQNVVHIPKLDAKPNPNSNPSPNPNPNSNPNPSRNPMPIRFG